MILHLKGLKKTLQDLIGNLMNCLTEEHSFNPFQETVDMDPSEK